jgi:hypothetical protein
VVGFAAIWSVFSKDTVPDFLARRGVVIEWLRVAAILAVIFLAVAWCVLAHALRRISKQPVIHVGMVAGVQVDKLPELPDK